MSDPTWLSLLPPLLAIVLAIWTRQVYLSLAGGAWIAWTILGGWSPLVGLASTLEGIVAVLSGRGDAEVILFTFVIGALLTCFVTASQIFFYVNSRLMRNTRFRMILYF